MKILSLTQPWATLWVCGLKRIETRSWGTKYRGPVAVHAAKNFPASCLSMCFEQPFKTALYAAGIEHPRALPTGCILGWVDVTDVLEMTDERVTGAPAMERYISLTVPDARLGATERAFGDYRPGRRAWVTGETRFILPEPIPYKGAQGLRDLPDEIAARLS